jgi:hypothetical protein
MTVHRTLSNASALTLTTKMVIQIIFMRTLGATKPEAKNVPFCFMPISGNLFYWQVPLRKESYLHLSKGELALG